MNKKRETVPKQKIRKQKSPSPTPVTHTVIVVNDLEKPSQLNGLPVHASNRSLRQTAIFSLQQLHGNSFVQRHYIQRQTTAGTGQQIAREAGRSSPSVFYVSFQNVTPPEPDHSQAHPGPGGATAGRAGYTQVTIRKRMTIAWETEPARSDGRIPLYARSVNVFYRLDPILVLISATYAKGSCPYRITLAHEMSHVQAFLRLFHNAREALVRQITQVTVPVQSAPLLIEADQVEATQNRIGNELAQVIRTNSATLRREMETDRTNKDSSANYAAVYAQCPSNEW